MSLLSDIFARQLFLLILFWTSFLMDEVCSDWGGNYTQCCWRFDAGTSTDIAFCGSSGQLSSFSVSISPLHTHSLAHDAQTSFRISIFGHHTTMDAKWLMNQAILFFSAPKPLLRTYQTSGSFPQLKTFFLLLCQRFLKMCFLFVMFFSSQQTNGVLAMLSFLSCIGTSI